MRRYNLFLHLCLVSSLWLASSCNKSTNETINQQLLQQLESKRTVLPNGWALTPPDYSIQLGDLPLNITVSPSGKLLAVLNSGYGEQSIMLIDAVGKKMLSKIVIPKSWYGLKFSNDEKHLYASGGNDNRILIYSITNDNLVLSDLIILGKPWPNKISPTGIDIDFNKNTLYTVTKEDSALYEVDLSTNKVSSKYKLPSEGYACLLDNNRKKLYISLWGIGEVGIFDMESQTLVNTIKVDSHPNAMLLSNDGNKLFVANANSNTVSIINLDQSKVVESLSTALYPDAPAGSTPNALALSKDNGTLYVANADNNCLAVFDVSHPGDSKSMGFIPTGWYPTAVAVDGKSIFVANGKGESSQANPKGPNPYVRKTADTQYIGGLFKGTLSVIPVPETADLNTYTQVVYENTRYSKEIEAQPKGEADNPIPDKPGQASPIKYVFYIIKENRTYDQVFGDLPQGNGDSTLCLFPEHVSPNHHALVSNYVLFDNFYVDSEVSADGHNWSMAAYATDYVEKNWPTSYSGRGGTYDYEGTRSIASPEKGYIWDYCQRAGISYRSYGEFISGSRANLKSLDGHFDSDFPGFNLSVMDTIRYAHWEQDFDSLLAIDAVPQFSTIRICNDHTSGASLGKRTPRAYVADNDLGVGRFVDHLSHSKIWNESVVFILEDDAQNGPDHVDAHRSVLMAIGPYVKRNFVDHTMYSTSSVLRTIELILGLPPMSQYDASATPLFHAFTMAVDTSSYECIPNKYPLGEYNTKNNALAKISASFDLDVEDAAPDIAFSEVIWKTVKGIDSQMPAPVRSAFVRNIETDAD